MKATFAVSFSIFLLFAVQQPSVLAQTGGNGGQGSPEPRPPYVLMPAEKPQGESEPRPPERKKQDKRQPQFHDDCYRPGADCKAGWVDQGFPEERPPERSPDTKKNPTGKSKGP